MTAACGLRQVRRRRAGYCRVHLWLGGLGAYTRIHPRDVWSLEGSALHARDRIGGTSHVSTTNPPGCPSYFDSAIAAQTAESGQRRAVSHGARRAVRLGSSPLARGSGSFAQTSRTVSSGPGG